MRSPVFITASVLLLTASVTIVASRETRERAARAPATAAPPVVVTDATQGHSFRNHVIPVLTKAGCNSGACHGAAAGKNGFSLTLRGYDPEADYEALTREAAGRRVNKLEPAKSLVLLKPTETVPHMGGKRFEPESPEYRVIARWIAAGMPAPNTSDPKLLGLEVSPGRQTLAVGVQTKLKVIARYSNGVAEDVSRWARYSAADETVAQVDQFGAVTIKGHGETAVNVGYLTGVSSVRIASPFPHEVPAEAYARAERFNFIDDHVIAKLRDLHMAPSGLASDSAFIRRAWLDAAGVLPPAEEVERFLADTSPSAEKRAALVDRILASEAWIDYWSYKWSDLLLVSSGKLARANVRSFYRWIRESVAANKPWDRFAYEITTATGRSTEDGAVNFFVIHRNQIDLTENFTQAFLGLSMTCARCHNHPLEKWTQRDYYAFSNLFSRVQVKTDPDSGKGDASLLVVNSASGEIRHPRTGEVLTPTPLDGKPMPSHAQAGPGQDRREYLARWLTAPENPLFARTVVNRVWANFFGRGLVTPVDDLRATNPASNDELFAAVTKDFVAQGYDVKRLMRTIMLSAAYQRSSEPNETNAGDDRFYSRFIVRRLPAEVILDAISQVTGVPEKFAGYPAGTRALQLPDTRVPSYFLDIFGRPERKATSAAERMQDPTLTQALHVINGDTIQTKLTDAEGTIARFARENVPDEQAVERLYLAALSRKPSADEVSKIAAVLKASRADAGDTAAGRQVALEDLAWALFTSKEFLFNH
jgi:Protein of unknown function (DUF1553)/Protein of unknown function (DUF1549)